MQHGTVLPQHPPRLLDSRSCSCSQSLAEELMVSPDIMHKPNSEECVMERKQDCLGSEKGRKGCSMPRQMLMTKIIFCTVRVGDISPDYFLACGGLTNFVGAIRGC